MLRHWFPLDQMNWSNLSANSSPHAIHLLSLPENHDKIDWRKLSSNIQAIDLLLTYPDKIDWTCLSSNRNPRAVSLLLQAFQEGDIHKICWVNVCNNHCPDIFPLLDYVIQNVSLINHFDSELYYLSANPVAMPLFLRPEHYEKINWKGMCMNPSPEAIALLSRDDNYHRINKNTLSLNPEAIPLLSRELRYSQEGIDWNSLAFNPHPQAIQLLKDNPDKINWYLLTGNKSREAFELVQQHDNRVSLGMLFDNPHALDLVYRMTRGDTSRYLWAMLSSNPGIFLEWTDVEKRPFKDELLEQALHPRRISAIYRTTGSLDGYI